MVLAADASSLALGRCRTAPVDPIPNFDRFLLPDYSSTTGPRPGSAPFWITHSTRLVRVFLSPCPLTLFSLSLSLSACILYTLLLPFVLLWFPLSISFSLTLFFLSFLFSFFSPFPSSRLSDLLPVLFFRHCRSKSSFHLSLFLVYATLALLRCTYGHSYTVHHQSLLYLTCTYRLAFLRHSSIPRQRDSENLFFFPPARFARNNKTSRTMPPSSSSSSPPPPPPPPPSSSSSSSLSSSLPPSF